MIEFDANRPGLVDSSSAVRLVSRRPLFELAALSASPRSLQFCFARQAEKRAVSSGRAAIFHALRILGVQKGDAVLVPSYHCPSIVAPVVALGARPLFYPLIVPGLPDTARISRQDVGRARAIIVVQLFGLPLDLSGVRRWCDSNGIPLVEDCAHSILGQAGVLPVGQWGDFATASLTKFLPVSELGLLYSWRRPIPSFKLSRSSLRSELKGVFDPLQIAANHGRLGLLGTVVRAVFRRREEQRKSRSAHDDFTRKQESVDVEPTFLDCDLERIEHKPSLASCLISRLSDWAVIAERRRHNYRRMFSLFCDAGLGNPLLESPPEGSAPYVLPLLVEDCTSLYPAMRRLGFPVYRWDRAWPGTTTTENDLAGEWRYRLLQIPVHQSYTEEDFIWLKVLLRKVLSIRRL